MYPVFAGLASAFSMNVVWLTHMMPEPPGNADVDGGWLQMQRIPVPCWFAATQSLQLACWAQIACAEDGTSRTEPRIMCSVPISTKKLYILNLLKYA